MGIAVSPSDSLRALAARAVRSLLGLGLGGLLGGVVFLTVAQQGEQRGASDLEFARSLGVLRGFEKADIPRQGLWTALVVALVLTALLLPPAQRLVANWWLRAIPLAVVTWLIWAFVYAPRGTFEKEVANAEGVAEKMAFDVGALGAEAGGLTPVIFALASLLGAIVAARVFDLMSGPAFWQAKNNDIRSGLDELAELGLAEREGTAGPASLELSEKRRPEAGQSGRRNA